MESPTDLLTVSHAMARAACSRATLVRAIQSGELKAVRLGRTGSYRIAPEALADWLGPNGDDYIGRTQVGPLLVTKENSE
jgi:excisionase family DNA binding protein